MPRKPGQCKNPQHPNAKPELAALYWELYQQGLSTTDIAKKYNTHRTAVQDLLKSHGYQLRTKIQLEPIEFNGAKYTLKPTGYYAKTNGSRSLLHRDVWEYHNGKIPPKHDIHHINHDRSDNSIENLELISTAKHNELHHKDRGKGNKRSVINLETGIQYDSIRMAAKSNGIPVYTIMNALQRTCDKIWRYAEDV